jgi:hypothetical protein
MISQLSGSSADAPTGGAGTIGDFVQPALVVEFTGG